MVPRSDAAREVHRGGMDDAGLRRFAMEAARLLDDLHCDDVLLLDVRGLSDVTDYVLIASGTSDRQIKSVGRDIEKLGGQWGLVRFGRDADEATTWLVIDFVDCVVHLFEPTARAFYDLEMMWGDAPRVDWRRGDD